MAEMDAASGGMKVRSVSETSKRSSSKFQQFVELLEMLGLYDAADQLVDSRTELKRSTIRAGRTARRFGFSAIPPIMILGYLGGIVAFTFFSERRATRKGLP
jgi:hypothetical protein